MKRKIALLLALILVVSCLTPALAANVPMPEPAPVPESTLYDAFGPWGEWTAEQTAAADSWTDANWETYWDDYSNWTYIPMMQYDEDRDSWTMERIASGALPDDRDDYLRERKVEMGMPYPDGMNLSLNGAYLRLDGKAPIAVENRTLVPFRGFFEELGATVRFADGKSTAILKNGDTVQMSLNSTQLERVTGGKITAIDMEVVPYAQAGRTYLPVRAVAEALGVDVYWDESYDAVHLTDWDALRDELDGQFTSYNAILAASLAATDPTKTYATTGSMSLSGTLYGEKQHDTATISMDISGLSGGNRASADVKLNLNLGGMGDTLFSMVPQEAMGVIDALSGSKYSVIVNGDEGAVYFKGDSLSKLPEANLPDNTWIGTQMDESVQEQFKTILSSQSQGFTLGELLVAQYRDRDYFYRESPWGEAMGVAKPFLMVLGDKSFTKQVSGTTTTYSMKVDMITLAKRAAEQGMLEDLSLPDLLTGKNELPTVDLKFSATVQSGVLTAISSSGTVGIKGVIPMEMTFNVSGTPASMKGTFAFKGAYVGKIEMTMDSKATVTTKTVPTAPPAGEKVVDLEAALGG